MMQFYFLSVAANLITGLALIFSKKTQEEYKFFTYMNNSFFKLICGIAVCFVCVITLFSYYPGSPFFIGDLLPSATGILGGASLLFDYFMQKKTIEITEEKSKKIHKLQIFFEKNNLYIGILCLASSLLHFLFPKVVIL
ncbi:MAG: hypothetical protein ACTTHG_06190 [Treponemataceae bacterium]